MNREIGWGTEANLLWSILQKLKRINSVGVTKAQLDTKENIVSGVVASGTNTYTATYSPTIAYTDGLKVIVRFTNANTGVSTININGLGAKSIVKDISTALSSGDIAAGATLLLVYNGTNFVAISGITSSSASSETFSFSHNGTDNSYGQGFATFPVTNVFRGAYGTLAGWTSKIGFDADAGGFISSEICAKNVPYDCYLTKVITRITYGGTSGVIRDFKVKVQSSDSGSSPSNGETTNRVLLVDTRINESVGGYYVGDITVNSLNIIDTNHLIPAFSAIRFSMACMGAPDSNYAINVDFYFKKA
jgi:hypothetical protein